MRQLFNESVPSTSGGGGGCYWFSLFVVNMITLYLSLEEDNVFPC